MLKKLIFFILFFIPVSLSSQNADIRLLRTINSSETLPSDDFFRFVSNSEVYIVIGTPAILATTGLLTDDSKMIRNAVVLLAGEAINTGLILALKYSVNRDRPYLTYPDITQKISVGTPSFPSGHTSSAFATATSVSLAYPKWYVIAPSFTWAGAVSYSRMHLGVHYPTDVLAGAVIGAGSAYLTYKINQRLNIKRRIKPCDCP
jgi:membrane-associated phospholipid phosphatase